MSSSSSGFPSGSICSALLSCSNLNASSSSWLYRHTHRKIHGLEEFNFGVNFWAVFPCEVTHLSLHCILELNVGSYPFQSLFSLLSFQFFLLTHKNNYYQCFQWSALKWHLEKRKHLYLQPWHQISLCLFLNKVCDPVRLCRGAVGGGLSCRARKGCFSFLQQSSCLLSPPLLIVCEPAQCPADQTQRLALGYRTCILKTLIIPHSLISSAATPFFLYVHAHIHTVPVGLSKMPTLPWSSAVYRARINRSWMS